MGSHSSRQVSARASLAVTPDDDNDLPQADKVIGLYIGTAGDLAYHDASGNIVAATAVGVGVFPVQVRRVLETTDAADILALYDETVYVAPE